MLAMLRRRQLGRDRPQAIEDFVCGARVQALQLSKEKELTGMDGGMRVHNSGVLSLDIDAVEGRYLLSAGKDRTIAIHDTQMPLGVRSGHGCPVVAHVARSSRNAHESSVSTVRWFPFDTGVFVSSGMDGALKIWDTNRLEVAEEFDSYENIYAHSISPVATAHNLIAVGHKGTEVSLCDMRSGSNAQILKGHTDSIYSVLWSPTEEFLLASGSKDSRILLWDVRRARTCLCSLDQFNGGGSYTFESVATAHNGAVNCLKFTPDGAQLVSAGHDGRVRLWNVSTARNSVINFSGITNKGLSKVEASVSTSGNPPVLFQPSGQEIISFNLRTGMKVATMRAHYKHVHSALFHPFRQELYTASNDQEILVWTPRVLEDAQEAEGHLEIDLEADMDNWSDAES